MTPLDGKGALASYSVIRRAIRRFFNRAYLLVFGLARLAIIIPLAAGVLAITAATLVPRVAELASANSSTAAEVDLNSLALRSVVFDSGGGLLGELAGEENRALVTLDQVSDEFIQTIIGVEDADFYRHNGVNVKAVVRALIQNVNSGSVQQGGSTITQQLIKNGVLSADQDLLDRKIPEAALAIRLESQMTKDEILERYLNTVYFGGGAYGIRAASELYFGVQPSELDWGQSAMLASLVSRPVGGDPTLYPDEARRRRERSLARLNSLDLIDDVQFTLFNATPLPTKRQSLFTLDALEEDYFLEEVKQALLGDPRLGETRRDRIEKVFAGGLRIYTTIDPVAQEMAERAVTETVPVNTQGFTGALAAVEPGSGAVRAMVGGPGFEEFKFNIATQKGRPTGSSFKPFVLATAMEAGMVPNDQVSGIGPCTFDNPGSTPYEAENFANSRGSIDTLRGQTMRSSNCGYLRLGILVGLDNVVRTAHDLGVGADIDAVPSLPLGPYDVTPLEMANSYATFANDGVRVDPYFIERVEDSSGEVIFSHDSVETEFRAISEQSARLVTSVLEANVRSGTGTRARLDGQAAAGKTGTAQDFGDAWFVGYTPCLATAVWMGDPAARTPMRGLGGINVTGGSFPSMIFKQFNDGYHSLVSCGEFEKPNGTRVGKRILTDDEEDARAKALRSPCGASSAEVDVDDDGTVDWCRDLGGLEFLGECPRLLIPKDTDGDGRVDRCVASGPPATTPPTTTEAPKTTKKPKPPKTTKKPKTPKTTQPPATQPPATQPPATQPPATQPPATQPPATQPPATQPPATPAPTQPPAAPPQTAAGG